MSDKKVIFSGVQPSGELTLGNYLGAIKNWIELQYEYECYYCIVDLHAITVPQVPKDLRRNTLEILAQYIASGIDPEKNTIFIQSHVSEHAELAWVLNCLTYMGELNRMTQFKEKSRKNEANLNAGLFTYPVLMAADILLYQTDLVPVGEDQKQHLELARDIAKRFNNRYSETFKIPEVYISKVGARIMSLQDPLSKMSKSDNNENGYILLKDSPDVIRRKIKRAVTDSLNRVKYCDEQPGIKNLITIYSKLSGDSIEEIEKRYEGQGYAKFKADLAEVVVEGLRPLREKFEDLMKNKDYLEKVYIEGANKAQRVARKTLSKVYRKVGFIQRKY
ncbi:tryptophan--tRNA ligase [Caloranaerobacter azorensis]|uniref:Tryptophan--tRNA ligase n=3 Tax=Caloranaerobacter azorensis TaxID=116090 RepID=A0A1M5R9T3_9FIRM|nr:tryptophan--tRNA ligase [Caloranaerobacter azorensis]KGG80221.1 tryptophanyl-tRNA synthetase [Caloranaerobacter azorensis H53214]QIB26789.1 tryptophan--tRNA ligase [Caloranaerobacter azorensis]SHH22860.1 tryptophanyl-tRNA synthetase [Caloranaerobacter azorensis DSM 13643]